jgi:hypothetical protein
MYLQMSALAGSADNNNAHPERARAQQHKANRREERGIAGFSLTNEKGGPFPTRPFNAATAFCADCSRGYRL